MFFLEGACVYVRVCVRACVACCLCVQVVSVFFSQLLLLVLVVGVRFR